VRDHEQVPYVLGDMGHIALRLGELDRAAQYLAEPGVVARQLAPTPSAITFDRWPGAETY